MVQDATASKNSPCSPQIGTGHDDTDQESSDASDDEGDPGHENELNNSLLGSEATVPKSRPLYDRLHELWIQAHGIVTESTPTLLLTTIGFLFSGELLALISRWRAMRQIDELIIIVPVILNLKGNLEMNLSARMSTAAHLGDLDEPRMRRTIILGNLCLLQVQAAAVSFISACVAFLLGLAMPQPVYSPQRTFTADVLTPSFNATTPLVHTLTATLIDRVQQSSSTNASIDRPKSELAVFTMVVSTAMSATCLSSLILGSFMCALVVVCRRYGHNPDNIAPPVASCLGDLIALCLIGLISSALIDFTQTPLPFVFVVITLLSSCICLLWTRRNPFVKDLLTQGWSPLFGAMVISSGTGIVLDTFISRYEGFALLSIIISGLPGSVGSIFVSRQSTSLHSAAASFLSLPLSDTTPSCKEEPSSRLVILSLLVVTLPVDIMLLYLIQAFGWLHLPFVFIAFSVLFFSAAAAISLYLAQFLTRFLWSKQLDPDIYALPIHAALMDLVGMLLLAGCYEVVFLLGIRVPGNRSRSRG